MFVGRTYKSFTTELMEGFNTLALGDPTPPTRPADGNMVDFELWKLDVKDYRTKIQEFANFRADLYSLVLDQCTKSLQEQFKIP